MSETDQTIPLGVRWAEFADAAPELAADIAARFAASLHHVLGTLRADGAPRLSGTEVAVAHGDVRLGMMPGSHKLRDVRRDPRVELHSAPLERNLVEGDARLSGHLLEEPRRDGDATEGVYLRLAIQRASLVRVVDSELHVTVWDPAAGLRLVRRS